VFADKRAKTEVSSEKAKGAAVSAAQQLQSRLQFTQQPKPAAKKAPKGNSGKQQTATKTAAGSGLWSKEHAPQCEEDMKGVIHPKKLAEIRQWLAEQGTPGSDERHLFRKLTSCTWQALRTGVVQGQVACWYCRGRQGVGRRR
jgi:hypothetical protein